MRISKAITVLMLLCALSGTAHAAPYTIDPVHSSVLFRANHLGFSHAYGVFTGIEGELDFDPEKPEEAAIEIGIDAGSINTFHTGRDEHLKGADFFQVKEHPEARFSSTSWKALDEGKYEVTGDFELLGVTQTMTITAELVGMGDGMKGEQRAGFTSTFTILRSDFGMTKYIPTVADEVQITVSIEAAAE